MRQIHEQLTEQVWSQHLGQTIPRVRFFTPTDVFWHDLRSVMSKYDLEMVIDCGTGNGDLPKEAEYQNIKMAGCDLIRREGNSPCDVQIMPAHMMPTTKSIWRMVCRPDHSGWAEGLLEKSLSEGVGFIYIGLPKNLFFDLGDSLTSLDIERYPDVGEDGEEMIVFSPIEGQC